MLNRLEAVAYHRGIEALRARSVYGAAITGMPQIVINADRTLLHRYGLNINDINRIINTAFAGKAGSLVCEAKAFRHGSRTERSTAAKPYRCTESANSHPAGVLECPYAWWQKVAIAEGPNQIQREDAQRRIIVGFNVKLAVMCELVVEELQQKVSGKIKLLRVTTLPMVAHLKHWKLRRKKRLGIAVPVPCCLFC